MCYTDSNDWKTQMLAKHTCKPDSIVRQTQVLDRLLYYCICTDGNTVFGCDSDKNSLVIIYMF